MLFKHNPSLTVLGKYKSLLTKIRVSDEDGIVYNQIPRCLLLSNHPRIIVAVNKTKAFKIKLKKILPSVKVLGEYISGNIKIRVRTELGLECDVKPESLLLGRTPHILTAIDKNKAFSVLANKIHNNRYDYSLINYTKNKKNIKIICKHHGVFEQRPNVHLNGGGCHTCHLECSAGWTKREWLKFSENKECMFYTIECFNETERFIKVGITTKSTNRRFGNKREMPYFFKTISEEKGNGLFVWDKEKAFIKENRVQKYAPLIKFKGHKECFIYKNPNNYDSNIPQ